MTEIQWRKSSYSQGNGNCIEIAGIGDGVLIRESDEPATVVKTSRAKWIAFIAGAKAGEFDPPE